MIERYPEGIEILLCCDNWREFTVPGILLFRESSLYYFAENSDWMGGLEM
jgi:hypothetical protein